MLGNEEPFWLRLEKSTWGRLRPHLGQWPPTIGSEDREGCRSLDVKKINRSREVKGSSPGLAEDFSKYRKLQHCLTSNVNKPHWTKATD